MSSSNVKFAPEGSQETRTKFKKACKLMSSCSLDASILPSEKEKLKFYGLHKQAINGPCNEPRPAFWDILALAKWDEWDSLKSMSREEAMTRYISTMKKMLKRYVSTSDTAKLILTTLAEPGPEIPAALTGPKPVLQTRQPLETSISSDFSPTVATPASSVASTPGPQKAAVKDEPAVLEDLVMENPFFSQSLEGLKSEYVVPTPQEESPVNETRNPPESQQATPLTPSSQGDLLQREDPQKPATPAGEDLQKPSKSFFVSDEDLVGNVADEAAKLSSGVGELEASLSQVSKKMKELEALSRPPSFLLRLRTTWIFVIPLLVYIIRRYIVKSIMT